MEQDSNLVILKGDPTLASYNNRATALGVLRDETRDPPLNT